MPCPCDRICFPVYFLVSGKNLLERSAKFFNASSSLYMIMSTSLLDEIL